MTLAPQRNLSVASNQQKYSSGDNKSSAGVVYDVILDEDSPILSDLEIPDDAKSAYVGAIRFRSDNSQNKSDDDLFLAFPKSLVINRLPLKNEVVSITNSSGGGYFYEIIAKAQTPNITSTEDTIESSTKKDKGSGRTTSTYSSVQKTSIPRSNISSTSDYNNYGSYFQFQPTLHKLKLYEGDSILESRFGQSIRFSAYNNGNNDYAPTIIIRNGESAVSQNKAVGTTTEEDVNRDGNIIFLGSGENKLSFRPGTVDQGGSTDFETKPDSFKDYPNELKGNQILLNSDRIIISSKAGEMIFYSKKNYGFISDGGLSIDNKGGITANVNDNIDVTTNDRDINLNTGNGKINLGDTDLEPVVKGDTLQKLLEELIDAINQQVFLTPSGPSATGPTNVATFQNIKSRLNTMLSSLNKTS